MNRFIGLGFCAIILPLFVSCGTSRTVVKVDNRAEGVTTSVTVSGNQAGETSINVSPNINLPYGIEN